MGNNPLNFTDPSGMGFWSNLFNFISSIFSNIFGGGGGGGGFGNIGGVNDGPWNEQLPISGGFGGPLNTGGVFGSGNTGPFIFSLSPLEHAKITLSGGGSIWDAISVVFADLGTQGTSGYFTHIHAMGGTEAPANLSPVQRSLSQYHVEGCAEAYRGTVEGLRMATYSAQRGDPVQRANAIHTIQDSYAAGHGYANWARVLSWAHVKGDWVPSAAVEASAQSATSRYLDALRGKARMGSPESYLAPKPAICP